FHYRVLYPQAYLPGRLDTEPVAGDRRHGEMRPRSPRRREPAPSLRADARCVGVPLRPELAADPGARAQAFRRALPAHLANLSMVVRGDVPLEKQPHAS